jgi:cytochrome P450
MNPLPAVPEAALDLLAPGFAADPYPAFEALRAQGPVTWHAGLNRFLVTGWQECASVLLGARDFGSSEADFIGLFGGRTMECMDRPRHGEVRGIWAHDFDPCPIAEMAAVVRRVIQARLDPFVARLRAGETVDAVSQFTRGIPTIIIAEMLGIDPGDYELFSGWSDAMGDMAEGLGDPGPRGQMILQRASEATAALNTYIRDRLDSRRRRPGLDLISKMVASPVSERMEESEIIASNTQLVFAGNETTAKLMAITLYALAQHPEQRRAILRDRSLVPQALEEIHRWNTIVHINGRFARGGNARVAGHLLPDGAQVMTLLGAANRDPARWERPDQLDIFRAPKNHMGFGLGMHVCLGMHLARLESQIWLNMLLDALPEWEVAAIDWGTNWSVRGPIRLEVQKS